jgi:adenylate cyclase
MVNPTPDPQPAVNPDEFDLRRFFEMSLDLCCIAGTDTFFRKVNPAFERVLGYTADELLKVSFIELIHPDHRETTLAEVAKLAQGESTVQFENLYRCRDGSWKWLSWSCPAADPSTGLIYAIARDITLQKQSEEALRIRDSTFSAISHGLVITDPSLDDNPIIYVNPAFEDLTGYSSKDIIGRNCRFLQNDDTSQPAIQTVRDAISKGDRCRVLLRNYQINGSLFWNELTISPVVDSAGVVTHCVGFQHDVTTSVGQERRQWKELSGRIESLTVRQRQVLDGLVAGQGIKQVASNLSISPKTAEMHRTNVLEKMQVPDVASLVRLVLSSAPQGRLD